MPPRPRSVKPVTPPAVRESSRERAKQVAAEINRDKRFGPGSVVVASNIVPPPPRLSTGSVAFDAALGGGLPANQWTEIVGQESSGKTSFVLKLIARQQAINPDFTVAWVAAEGWDDKLAAMCGVDPTGVFLIEENVMELAYEALLKYVEARACDLAVIDSYPALTTEQEDGKTMEEVTMGGAKVTNQFMRKMTKAGKRSLLDSNDRPFSGIFINQWREKIGVMHGDPRTTSGGKGKNYWMYCRIDFRRDDWLLDSQKRKVGQAIKLVVMKMKGARPQQVGVTDYYFADHDGFKAGEYDEFKALVSLALLFELIERSGSGYRHPDGAFMNSGALLVATLRSDVAWRAQVEADVLRIASHGKAPVEIDADVVALAPGVDEEDAPSAKPTRRRRTIA